MRFPSWIVLVVALACSALAAPPVAQPLLKQGNARLVLVGDSITGQSRNHPAGYAYQLEWALQQAYPGCHPNVVSLGGSGQGVQAWLNTEKRSRTDAFPLDVKGIEVKAALDQPADVLVIMLGMNDVLAPYVVDEPASWEQWTAHYRELITSLQTRAKPIVTAVATATLCTEDPDSPKNRVMDKLNAHLTGLAQEMGLLVLPTNQTMREVLARGRRLKPDFHVTGDFVHPNEVGHIAIAIGMLRGLGENKAASALDDQKLPALFEKTAHDLPAISYEMKHLEPTNGSEKQKFLVRFGVKEIGVSSEVKLSGEGWDVTPVALSKPEGDFIATGLPDHWTNALQLTARVSDHAITRDILIPAPWLVTAGVIRKGWNDKQIPDAAAFRGPIEEAIEQHRDFTTALDAAKGQRPAWQPYFASVNFTGGANPDSVDFAAVTHAHNFEAGYGARWIHSDRDRGVNIELSTQVFAGTMQMGVWLNGASLYSGLLTGEPGKKKTVPAQLHTGWNTLVFALNHTAWQMQCAVHLAPSGDDTLNDLRYSINPHDSAP